MSWSQEAQAYAQENGLFFMETSAKTATNVNDIFYEIGMTFYCVVLEFISQISQRLKLKYESTLLSWSFGVRTCIEQLLLLLFFGVCWWYPMVLAC